VQQTLEMLDRQVLIGEWTARQVPTHWPISGGCEHPIQWSGEVSQQGMVVQYHADTDGSGRAKLQSNCYHQQTNTQFFYRPSCHPTSSVKALKGI